MQQSRWSEAGLPDGIFSNQKSQFGQILEGLEMENVGIFYGYLENITAIWYILWPFGKLVIIWYFFSQFWFIVSKKIWQPRSKDASHSRGRIFCVGLGFQA
jgi:hypothetical protein